MMHFQRPAFFFFSDLSILYYNESYIATKTKKDTPAPTCVPLGKWLDQYGNVVSKRKKQNRHVCRLGFENPAVADLFYLRLFLHNARSRSFASLRTIEHPQNEPTVRQTFPAAARARGLVTGYEEQSICMQEQQTFQTAKQLRYLFVVLFSHCGPAPKLWPEFEDFLMDDLQMRFNKQDAVLHALRAVDLTLPLHGNATNN